MKAMILAAGFGTRLKPFTDKHPKALAPVNGKSLLQRNIEYLLSYGYDEIIVNVHHFADQIMDAVKINNGWGASISFSDETDAILETGGGLKRAAHFFEHSNEVFVLMNVDILTDLDLNAMRKTHLEKNPLATLAVRNRETSRYLLFNEDNELVGWRNASTNEEKISRVANNYHPKAFSGVHLIEPKLLKLITQEGKFSMIDVYLNIAKEHIIRGYDHSDSKMIDVGKPESIEKAEKLFV
ncbi:MAG: nucleotidyltransferase family protein [Bacteroidota bacterium]